MVELLGKLHYNPDAHQNQIWIRALYLDKGSFI